MCEDELRIERRGCRFDGPHASKHRGRRGVPGHAAECERWLVLRIARCRVPSRWHTNFKYNMSLKQDAKVLNVP